MDIHTVNADTLSVEDVVKAHMQDLAIQDQFGVKQIKYWVNEDAKTLFCLMNGPNKESCHQVHKQSHGATACNIIEVSDNEYNLFMGIGTDINDLAQTQSGELDTGYRTILLAHIIVFENNRDSFIKEMFQIIEAHNGTIILDPCSELMISFIHANEAVLCAKSIYKWISSSTGQIEFNLAISSGRPVDEKGDEMFEETKKKVHSLCHLGLSSSIFVDEESKVLAEKELHSEHILSNEFQLVNANEINLAVTISRVLNENLTSSNFSSTDLYTLLSLSKSQAYRKIKSLSGMAPNQLIQESRLQTALQLILQKDKSISEIAYDSGFNSPTYFTRVFKKRFGISPSDFFKN